MKLLVFGGSEPDGGAVVRQALADGHEVTLAMRRPDVLAIQHERLDVVRADVLSGDGLDGLFVGKEAVLFTVASPDRKTTLLYSDGVANVTEAMRAAGVTRLIAFSSTIVEVPTYGIVYRLWVRFVLEKVLRNRVLDLARMEDELRHSQLDWTVVRLPRLRAGAAPAREVRAEIDRRLVRPRPLGGTDVARFVLSHVDDPAVYRTVVEIGA